jgi:methionyl-tRNA formyltransferase
MRVAFLGNARWSVPSLEAVAASPHHVALVVTRIPRPARRGRGVQPTPVAEAARRLGLPLMEAETVKAGSGLEALSKSAPEVLTVIAYGEILPPAVLALPTVAPVNVHFSLLPELRGAAPVHRAILDGHAVTGATTIRMDEGLDTGPVLLQAEEEIRDGDDGGSLGDRLAALGGRLLVETLDGLENGSVTERPQDEARATHAPKLTAEDRVIRWDEAAEHVVRRVRALAPDPGATTTFRGKVLKVLRVSVGTVEPPADPPGSIRVGADGDPSVVAIDGVVRLLDVAPEGRRRMSGAEFVRGYRPKVGEVLG